MRTLRVAFWSLAASGVLVACSAADSSTTIVPNGASAAGGVEAGGNGSGASTGGSISLGGMGAGTSGGSGGQTACTGSSKLCDVPFCGDGKLNQAAEQCDDGNNKDGDGCSQTCQAEANWVCLTPGQPCVNSVKCGDGNVIGTKECDDGNTTPGDGCSATCKLEDGYECRVPGKRCAPQCGDGKLVGSETCDLGTVNDPGCVNCQVVAGFTCDQKAKSCVKAECGNGKLETGEVCDKGALNGLFYGDATGCSKTCTPEPDCRDASGHNQACTSTCGDGNTDPGEACDDGNKVSGDGCSTTCTVESGFKCEATPNKDSTPCSADPTASCLNLPVIYRDFKSTKYAGKGGHPDFPYMFSNYLNSNGTATTSKIVCVPTAAGLARAAWGGSEDSVARCTGLAKPDLVNGKMVFNATRTGGNMCDCNYTDWNTGEPHLPGYAFPLANGAINTPEVQGVVDNTGAQGKQKFHGKVQIVKDANSFAQWFTDVPCTATPTTPCNRKVTGTLALPETAAGSNQYLYASGSDVINTGFFPLDGSNPTAASWGEATECNLWPYWYSNDGTHFAGCVGPQYLFAPFPGAPAGTAANPPGGGKWFENASQITGKKHDSLFTTEVHYLFVYNDALTLKFYGDDDLWIYVNGVLALDLGGIHQQLPGQIDISDPNGATPGIGHIQEAGLPNPVNGNVTTAERVANVDFKMVKGKIYEIAIFGADRHQRESNFQLTLSGFTTTRSVCTPRCGDGVVTGAEECDNGAANSDTEYGGCTTTCKWGPFCGDKVVQSNEQCDDGRNQSGYSRVAGACGPGCKKPAFCGDGKLDSLYGELCDNGAKNSDSTYNGCSLKCQRGPRCGDGVVQKDQGETCDNGVNHPGSGCSPTCLIEEIR